MGLDKRIPAIVFAYYDLGMLRATLDHLTPLNDRLTLTVVENPSLHTESSLRPYLSTLLEQGKIDRYILFHDNITNNALEIIFDDRLVPFSSSRYVFLTDGDVVPDNPGWLDEQRAILERHPEVVICSARLNLDN